MTPYARRGTHGRTVETLARRRLGGEFPAGTAPGPVPRRTESAPSRRPARFPTASRAWTVPLPAAPAHSPSPSGTGACGRPTGSTHRTQLLDGPAHRDMPRRRFQGCTATADRFPAHGAVPDAVRDREPPAAESAARVLTDAAGPGPDRADASDDTKGNGGK